MRGTGRLAATLGALVLATTDPILGLAQMGDTILDVTYGIHLEQS